MKITATRYTSTKPTEEDFSLRERPNVRLMPNALDILGDIEGPLDFDLESNPVSILNCVNITDADLVGWGQELITFSDPHMIHELFGRIINSAHTNPGPHHWVACLPNTSDKSSFKAATRLILKVCGDELDKTWEVHACPTMGDGMYYEQTSVLCPWNHRHDSGDPHPKHVLLPQAA